LAAEGINNNIFLILINHNYHKNQCTIFDLKLETLNLKLIECPRDAMQSLSSFIPTETKVDYINALLRVGFDTIDFGSFVSPKAIPQLRDTAEVIKKLDLTGTNTKLLSIIANMKGSEIACAFDEITYLGFPHAISPTFLKLNINSTPEKSIQTIESINNLLQRKSNNLTPKNLIVYLSLAFGNPYGEEWNINLLIQEIDKLKEIGIDIIILADTLGDGTKDIVSEVFDKILNVSRFNEIEFGFHLHTSSDSWFDKVDAAFNKGCRRFDSVMLGLGGCPMSHKELIGNLSTENLLSYFQQNNITIPLDMNKYHEAHKIAQTVFN
jgi:hydroxymethylglutaryl-CoA lyase